MKIYGLITKRARECRVFKLDFRVASSIGREASI
jgi:hypothetical protein